VLSQSSMKKANIVLLCVVLALAFMALIAELLPEVEAKIIVIPTLIVMIGICILELRRLNVSSN
jgi:hypothetical protein